MGLHVSITPRIGRRSNSSDLRSGGFADITSRIWSPRMSSVEVRGPAPIDDCASHVLQCVHHLVLDVAQAICCGPRVDRGSNLDGLDTNVLSRDVAQPFQCNRLGCFVRAIRPDLPKTLADEGVGQVQRSHLDAFVPWERGIDTGVEFLLGLQIPGQHVGDLATVVDTKWVELGRKSGEWLPSTSLSERLRDGAGSGACCGCSADATRSDWEWLCLRGSGRGEVEKME